MKPIERYIQFAIDNEFNIKEYLFTSDSVKKWVRKGFESTATVSDIELITSKKFIEAIARGIIKNNIHCKGNVYCVNGNHLSLPYLEDGITTEQALMIREDKLDEYINNLLGECNQKN